MPAKKKAKKKKDEKKSRYEMSPGRIAMLVWTAAVILMYYVIVPLAGQFGWKGFVDTWKDISAAANTAYFGALAMYVGRRAAEKISEIKSMAGKLKKK